MAQLLKWDEVGDRVYETGVDHGVLYPQNPDGTYPLGVVWNGLTTVTEKPTGADANPQFADNIKYLNLLSAEEFGATIEAFTYPAEFGVCDGSAEVELGAFIGQQARKPFGLCYRTLIGNDTEGQDHGFKLHLVYGCLASPSERGYQTVNDSPEAINFSWDVTTTPVPVTGFKPTSVLTIDSTLADPTGLAALEVILYGATGTPDVPARLPLPDEVITILGA